MNKRSILWVVLLLAVAVTACFEGPSSNTNADYLNLDSLLQDQIRSLSETSVELVKEVTLADSTQIRLFSA
ncbi:MAG: hypothetical protein AAGA85_21815, partial [Bacteroidota bacterium]